MGEAGTRGLVARINFNSVLAAACIAFSVLLFLLVPWQVERPPMVLGQSASSLDPAFFPNLVAAGFLLVGVWYLRASFRLAEANGFRGMPPGSHGRIGVTVLAFVVYASILEPLGFVLSSAIVAGALSLFYGARSIVGILLIAIAVPAAVYAVFRRLLSVALPEFPDF